MHGSFSYKLISNPRTHCRLFGPDNPTIVLMETSKVQESLSWMKSELQTGTSIISKTMSDVLGQLKRQSWSNEED